MKKSKRPKKAKTSTKPIVFELPSSNVAMENFIVKNWEVLMDSIVTSIEYAVEENLGGVEIFRFKKSNYIVVISKKDYMENLDHIFNYSMSIENYELCGRVAKVKKLISSPKFSRKQKSINLI